MNLNKHLDFFNPALVTEPIHIIGCGALGSHTAELLVRLGCDNIHLWDFDVVSPHNITNQLFVHKQIGQKKTIALDYLLHEINPQLKTIIHSKYEMHNLSGYVFMMVDSIELRRAIVEHLKDNKYVKGLFDARMRLTDAQSYGADWTNQEDITALLNTMQFSGEEAKASTPVSACGTALSVTPTVKIVASVTVSNFINLMLGKELKRIILLDAFSFNLNAF
jgi:molybdopterin/thiamine biosynthesis adenylyltransferase